MKNPLGSSASSDKTDSPTGAVHRPHRSLGLLQATAMNMSNMVGVGPFLTIPLILGAMGGPQALLGWLVGAVVAICDGLVWAELASAVPVSGVTFEYLKAAYAATPLRRLLPFLFIWQFVLSGPLEIASGSIGFAKYFCYLLPLSAGQTQWLACGVSALAVALLYRKIESVGRLMVALWIGVLATVGVILVSGLMYFDTAAVFTFPPNAFRLSSDFFFGLGAAMSLAMYDFLGYYSVCYVGDEVRAPARTIPRSILISVVVIAGVYLTMNISLISVVPWAEAMRSEHIASDFMARLYGPAGGVLITVAICWTAFAAVFVLMLGYSRIPYAAARDGYFFAAFGQLHPRGDFPHRSLLVLGAVAVAASFFPLDDVINALISTRIVVQFAAQIGGLALLRRRGAGGEFRMALYPLPAVIALLGWLFIFATASPRYIAWGLASLAAGAVAFWLWTLSKASESEPLCDP